MQLLLLAQLPLFIILATNRLSHCQEAASSYVVSVVRELPHVGAPFTQGLEFSSDGQYLIETSGAYPPGQPSFIRRLDPRTGQQVGSQVQNGFGSVFLEGIVELGSNNSGVFSSLASTPTSRWLVTTYDTGAAFLLDEQFQILAKKSYPWTGWGLTLDVDGNNFLATDGSESLLRLDRNSLNLVGKQPITCLGQHVAGVNELEMVPDFLGTGQAALLGNLMGTRLILVIDPATGRCRGAFHLGDVSESQQDNERLGFHVANGIAYDRNSKSFYVTGKNWEKMFEVKLSPSSQAEAGLAQSTSSVDAVDLLQQYLATAPAAPPGSEKKVVVASGTGRSFLSMLSTPNRATASQVPVFRHGSFP